MGKGKNKDKYTAKSKKAQREANQQEKQQERKSKREQKREKNKFNKVKYESDMTKFRVQLTQYGLKCIEVGGDGNCLFRSIADQLEGNEKIYKKYRMEAIEHIEQNKDDFIPFIEDDETIDQYLADMEKDGTWGGQLELTALSTRYRFNYIIHQVDNPIMAFGNYPWGSVPTIHLSYHLGEHYNSVRKHDDSCTGPAIANPIGHELTLQEAPKKTEEEKKQEEIMKLKEEQSTVDEIPTRDQILQYSLQVLGCQNAELMAKALDECFGLGEVITYDNIEQLQKPILAIYEELEIKSLTKEFNSVSLYSNGDGAASQLEEFKIPHSSSSQQQLKKKELTDEEKVRELSKEEMILSDTGEIIPAPAKNKKCPCKSKKNYKNCSCYTKDLQRKTEFINRLAKKIEKEGVPRQNSILLL